MSVLPGDTNYHTVKKKKKHVKRKYIIYVLRFEVFKMKRLRSVVVTSLVKLRSD